MKQNFTSKNIKPVFFTPGPSELFYTVPDHLRTALREGIPSIYHRSPAFKEIVRTTTNHIKTIFNLPPDYRVVFASSATEIWERMTLNLIGDHAGFIVNGSFSERFASVAEQWGKKVERCVIPEGQCADPATINFNVAPELIGITHNETSTGAMHSMADIYTIKKRYPESIIAVDIVSSAPTVDIDFTQIDCAYFSVQKGFGLPSGLGVWMFNERCLEKSRELEKGGKFTGSYHRLVKMAEQIDVYQTPSTPNMIGIYLLGKVAEDLLNKGLENIMRETRYKAALVYQTLLSHKYTELFVANETNRSLTTIVAEVIDSEQWVVKLLEKNIVIGQGYGLNKPNQIRIANFPTHSKEQMELLVDEIVKLK